MQESAMRTWRATVTDECRQLAELLGLDALGIVSDVPGRRRVAWWTAPGSAPLPARLDDVLEGRVDGWISFPLANGAVFARITPATTARAPQVLRILGPQLAAAASGAVAEHARAAAAGAGTRDDPAVRREPQRHDDRLDEVHTLARVVDAVRLVLEDPAGSFHDLLEAARQGLAADELFHLSERADEIEVTRAPADQGQRRVPPEVHAKLLGLAFDEPIDDATARQLGVVLGALSPQLLAAFCSESAPIDALVAGWGGRATLPPEAMAVVARTIGAGRVAIGSRGSAVESLLLAERTRWAFEIHDGLTQAVTAAVLELESIRRRIEDDPRSAVDSLDDAKAEIRRSLETIRAMLFELSGEEPGEPDGPALTREVDDVARRWRLPAHVEVDGDIESVPRPVAEAAYVVIRESLANAAKHAAASDVDVRVSARDGQVVVEVKDGGRGFDVATPNGNGTARHFGLEMMRKRVAEVDGTLEIESSPGKGTRVVARLPVKSQGEKP